MLERDVPHCAQQLAAHRLLQVVTGQVKFEGLPGRIPLQLLAHHLDDARQGSQGSLRVDKGKRQPPRHHINQVLGVFMATGIPDLSLDEGMLSGSAFVVLIGRSAHTLSRLYPRTIDASGWQCLHPTRTA